MRSAGDSTEHPSAFAENVTLLELGEIWQCSVWKRSREVSKAVKEALVALRSLRAFSGHLLNDSKCTATRSLARLTGRTLSRTVRT